MRQSKLIGLRGAQLGDWEPSDDEAAASSDEEDVAAVVFGIGCTTSISLPVELRAAASQTPRIAVARPCAGKEQKGPAGREKGAKEGDARVQQRSTQTKKLSVCKRVWTDQEPFVMLRQIGRSALIGGQ